MTIFIIGIIIFIIYIVASNDNSTLEKSNYTNYNAYKPDQVIRNELTQKLNKNINVTVTIRNSLKKAILA